MDYQKVYNDLISHRKSNPLEKTAELYTELHHIVPRCLGGTDDAENLVRLTAREHFIAHRLLSKIHPQETGLALAVLLMMKVQGGKISSSREIEKLKEMWLHSVSALWGNLQYRNMMKECVLSRWGDEGFRNKMTEVHTEKAKKQWEDPSYRSMMANMFKESSETRWKDPNYRDIMTVQSRNLYKNNEFVKKKEEGYKKFLASNPWPWTRPTGIAKKHIWTLAASFFVLRKEENYNYSKFIREFLNDKHESIFRRMENMFIDGWNPLECDDWLKEFEHKM